MNKFKHENIIKLLDYVYSVESRKGRIACLLFPFSNSGSLRDILNRQIKILPEKGRLKSVLSLFSDVCAAVNVLHTYNPPHVHRDIKPEVCSTIVPHWMLIMIQNIMFNDRGKPILIDFGSVSVAEYHVTTRSDVLILI